MSQFEHQHGGNSSESALDSCGLKFDPREYALLNEIDAKPAGYSTQIESGQMELSDPFLGARIAEFDLRSAEYKKLADKHQLDLEAVKTDGKTEWVFSAKINGDKHIVLKTDEAPAQVDKDLLSVQDKMVNGLEKTFGVKIARDGETVSIGSGKNERQVPVTTPTVGELVSLEQGLLRSAPDTETVSGKPLRLVIGDKDQDIGKNIVGFFVNEQVVIANSKNLSYMTEVAIHELHHVGQSELYAKPGAEVKYAEKLGWVRAGDSWLMRGKDGSFWQNTGKDDLWIRTDRDGNPADQNGKRVDNPVNPFDHGEKNDRLQLKKTSEVREIAVVKPYSDYCGNPTEMGAALLTPFRDGHELRAKLYAVSADSYQIAKEVDQKQIDDEFGLDAKGEAKLIRSPDGILVDNTEENRRQIREFEKGLQV